MKDCRACINWIDESLAQIEMAGISSEHIFFGCRIYGNVIDFRRQASACPDYKLSAERYAICVSCGSTVPKICISLGECINCIDTDLWCVERCQGGVWKKRCEHFVRLTKLGHALISDNIVFEIYPEGGQTDKSPGPKLKIDRE